jgi:NADH-quinone oxidoreductase subunit M
MSASQFDFPILTIIVLVPAGAGLIAAFCPEDKPFLFKAVAALSSVVTVGLAAWLTGVFNTHVSGYQDQAHDVWISQYGISWHLGVDGISLLLLLMTVVVFPLALLATAQANRRTYVAWMLVLETACLGAFLSVDVLLFFLFFELTLVPTYFLMTGFGYERSGPAAVKFFLYTFLGSAFMLVALLSLVFLHEHATGHLTFNLVRLERDTGASATAAKWIFLGFTAAFAVKTPIFPFHTWSPDAYSQAPTGTAVSLVAVMAKLGTYGLIRFDLGLFPKATIFFAPLLLTLGVVGILYGAVVASVQKDFKRVIAYSSLSHLGFVVLGLFALTTISLSGGVLQMFNHGIVTAGLLLLIGMIYERTGTWQLDQLRGIQREAPLFAGVMMLFVLAAVGLPGTNGFVGEFLILLGSFSTRRWWAVAATIGVILAALYMLWAYQRAFHGKREVLEPAVAGTGPGAMHVDEHRSWFPELRWSERLAMAPLVVLVIFVGIYPAPFLHRIEPSVSRLVDRVELATGYHQPAVDQGSASMLRGGKG